MILLIGGTGYVGTRVLTGLLVNGYPVRTLIRGVSDWKSQSRQKLEMRGAEVVVGDILSERAVDGALEGCKAVVNLSGIIQNHPERSFREIHVEALSRLVKAAERRGIQRFVHVSCLGSSEHSQSELFNSKWGGEKVVQNGKFHWTIFRPAVIFGEGCRFIKLLGRLASLSPVIPVFGSGLSRMRPIWVEDVATCIVQCIYNRDTSGQIYDLVGPVEYSLKELMEMMVQSVGNHRPMVNVPSMLAVAAVHLLERLRLNLPITSGELDMILTDMIGRPEVMQSRFQVKMQTMDRNLKHYLTLS